MTLDAEPVNEAEATRLRQALADQLQAVGDLRTAPWKTAFLTTPGTPSCPRSTASSTERQ